jgi:hypothetical protein
MHVHNRGALGNVVFFKNRRKLQTNKGLLMLSYLFLAGNSKLFLAFLGAL